MAIPTDTIDTLLDVFADLSALGATLEESQWKTMTDLPGWSVQDNLSHLVAIERMLEGLPATEHRAAHLEHTKNPIGEMNEHEVDMRRALPGAAVLAEWDEIAARRATTLRSAGDEYFDAPTMTPTGPGTIADFLHIRVLDCWAHEQDIRWALGLAANMTSPGAAHTIDRLVRTLPIVVGKRAATPDGQAVRFEITGDVRRTLVYAVRDGRAVAVDPTDPAWAAPAATVSMDAEVFARLALGRRTSAEMGAAVHCSGDVDLAERVAAALNMMI